LNKEQIVWFSPHRYFTVKNRTIVFIILFNSGRHQIIGKMLGLEYVLDGEPLPRVMALIIKRELRE